MSTTLSGPEITIKVTHRGKSATVEVLPAMSLFDLAHLIMDIYDWSDIGHAWNFYGKGGDIVADSDEEYMERYVGNYLFKEGQKLKFVYDLGDVNEHRIIVMGIAPIDNETEYPNIIKTSRGIEKIGGTFET